MSRPVLFRVTVAAAATIALTASVVAASTSGTAATAAAPPPAPTITTAPFSAAAARPLDEASLAGAVVGRDDAATTSRRELDADSCPDGFTHDPAVGCLREAGHGLAMLATPDGDDVLVASPHHHGDAELAAAAGSDWYLTEVARRPVVCAPAHTPRAVAVYVHRPGKARLSSVVGTIRQTIEKSSGAVAASARRSGGPVADLRFACTKGGAVAVVRVASSGSSYAQLRQAVRDAGHDRPATKYLIFADMRSPDAGVAGVGQMFPDDRRTMDNANNGAAAMYAAAWQPWWSSSVPLHEFSHTMGAVQSSAPSNYAGAHCDDSYDIMCYTHDGRACAQYVFDCRNDSYFSTAPAAGSYLATHWNLGWHGNRFVDVAGRPTPNTAPTARIRTLDCTTWTCGADGRGSSDLDGRIAKVRWRWGDGTTTTGWRSSHRYTADGTYTVRLTVVDDRGGQDSTTGTVTVSNEAPTAAIDVSCDGRACTFDGTGASDRDGTVRRWRWTVDGADRTGRSIDHTFDADGTHEVTSKVADNDGRWSPAVSRTVTVCGDTATAGQMSCRAGSGAGDPAGTVSELVGAVGGSGDGSRMVGDAGGLTGGLLGR